MNSSSFLNLSFFFLFLSLFPSLPYPFHLPFLPVWPSPPLTVSSLSGISLLVLKQQGISSLQLQSLREISAGNVHIAENSQLCYYHTVNWTRLFRAANQKVLIRNNRSPPECCKSILISTNHMCAVPKQVHKRFTMLYCGVGIKDTQHFILMSAALTFAFHCCAMQSIWSCHKHQMTVSIIFFLFRVKH